MTHMCHLGHVSQQYHKMRAQIYRVLKIKETKIFSDEN